MPSRFFRRGRGVTRSVGTVATFVAAVTLLATACNTDKLLRVKDPDVATPGSLDNPLYTSVLLAGAVGDFQAAYQGTGNVNESSGQIGYSGLLGDEIRSSDSFPTRNEVDQRSIQLDNSSNESQFILLSQARASADRASAAYEKYAPADSGHVLSLALSGFASILFAENYCSGVPISTTDASGNITYGQPLTTQQMLERAVTLFDSALKVQSTNTRLKNLARIGKGRALVDLGQYAVADTVVASVPDNYAFYIESSDNSSRQNNGVWIFNQSVRRLTLVDREGGNGLDYLSSNDPRVEWKRALTAKGDTIRGFDKITPLIYEEKYPERSSDVPLATGIEARLIQAEAAMHRSLVDPGFLTNLNAARAQFAGVPALTVADIPTTAAGQVDLLFRERAFDLFLTSHRLGDMRRLSRTILGGYGRDKETVFPTGTFFKGGQYGPDVNFPVPVSEQNNPNFTACLDRNP